MGATEIVQALVSPTEKLIDAVSGAIGKAYEPRHVRKMAEAKSYELKLIADTVRNNSDVPIVYDSTGVVIDTSNYEEIAKRASCRLAFQEITKQQNIESIADKAYEELENSDSVSNVPVSQDWMSRFFNSVEDISDDKMQEVWAHILASEIKTPNTYSYRTIDKLKNMTRNEAELFQRVAGLSMRGGSVYFILSDKELLNSYGVYFSELLSLEECGLISTQSLTFKIEASEKQPGHLMTDKYIGFIRGRETDKIQEFKLNIYVFTESGKQLINAIHPQTDDKYFIDCMQKIHQEHSSFSVAVHRINYITDDGRINYNDVDILSTINNVG
ncbi:MAG: DUF2806 domain-containing protein [Clostridia bacterium]